MWSLWQTRQATSLYYSRTCWAASASLNLLSAAGLKKGKPVQPVWPKWRKKKLWLIVCTDLPTLFLSYLCGTHQLFHSLSSWLDRETALQDSEKERGRETHQCDVSIPFTQGGVGYLVASHIGTAYGLEEASQFWYCNLQWTLNKRDT